MSAGKHIRSAHTEMEKRLVDGRNLKGAKERNKYLMPGDPQSHHVLNTGLGKYLPYPGDDEQMTLLQMILYLLGIPSSSSSSPSFQSQSPNSYRQKLGILTNIAVLPPLFPGL
jgi:hypothetical protein